MRQVRRIDSRGPSGAIRRLASFVSKAFICIMLAITAMALLAASAAQATVITSGDIVPTTDPATWTFTTGGGTAAYIGYTANGTLSITGGSSVGAYTTNIGYRDGASGTLTVDGSGSTFNTFWMYLAHGFGSSAAVNVTNGGTVTSKQLEIAYTNGDTSVHPSQLYPGSTAAINIDGVGSKWTIIGSNVYIGSFGTGSMSITNGGAFYNYWDGFASAALIGVQEGAVGKLTVDGAGSTFYCAGQPTIGIDIGYDGHGTLTVTNGGTVSTGTKIRIGVFSHDYALGTAVVNGAGSSLNAGAALFVGDYGAADGRSYGAGRLSVTDGGKVTASILTVNGNVKSVLTTDVGRGSSIIVGDGAGTINNYGKIHLVAGTAAATGTYTPMSYGTLSGNAPVAVGGVWNDTTHTVTVNAAATAAGIGGATAAFNLAVAQRAIITDTATGHSVGAGFVAGTDNVTFNAAALSPTALAALQGLLASGNTVLSAWNFSATGYTVSADNPVYLSLFAGPGQSLYGLGIWHYDGSNWSAYDAYDLAYDGTYASFTVTGFSGYAVTTGGATATPIPAGLWLLGPGLAGLVGMRRRLFKNSR
jgi:T5SS/PEP-CTERM-associated repeat protein